jgi:RNA polymerase-associated protein CTR9
MGVLGKFYRGKNMYNESLIAFQEALELIPNDAGAYMGMGITYWEMGEKQLARASWERSLELKPENNESKGWLILSSQGS